MVRELVVQHLGLVEETVAAMAAGLDAYLGGRPWEEVEELAVETHRRESRADDARRKAELELVQGALLAGSRERLLSIVEGADRVANAAEATMNFLSLQRVSIPDLLHPLIREMTEVTKAQMIDLRAAVIGLLDGDPDTVKRLEEVDHKEGRVDELKQRAIKRLFALEMDLAEKILVREFIEKLAEISDQAEDLSDIVLIAVAVGRP